MWALTSGPVRGQEVLRVAFNELPPYKLLEPGGRAGGIDSEFLRLVARRMGYELEFINMPFIRAMHMLKAGDADVMTGVLRRADRESFLHFVEPPYRLYSNKAFYLLKGNGGMIQSYDDLYGLTIGVARGVKYFPTFDHDPRIKKDDVAEMKLNYNKLLHHRFEAFISTEDTGDYWLRELGLEDRIEKAPYVYRKVQPVHIVVSRNSPLADRLDELGAVVRELLNAGEYERIRREFLPQ